MILGQLGSRKPVEFFEYRRNVVKLLLSAYNSGAEIDDFLDPVKLCLGTRAVDCHTVPEITSAVTIGLIVASGRQCFACVSAIRPPLHFATT